VRGDHHWWQQDTSTAVSQESARGGHHWLQQLFGNSDDTSTTISPDSAGGGRAWWQQVSAHSTTEAASTIVSADSLSDAWGHHWQQMSAGSTTSATGGHDWHQHANFWHH
jgi:hypothetical protein